ncbi:hypothetical protein QFC19_005514 [Naganishia cerealis]|uniref:Uncharacterized protein n=1 Tax=Naganishia cerealis TaxID=610337 RepID=A0ACC2VNW6_9TREE|nr:hypothetical protein QFC19_005514 [Naganishia cerealis]
MSMGRESIAAFRKRVMFKPSQDPDNSSPSFYEPSSPPFQSDARMAYCAAVSNDITKLAKYPYSRHSAPYTRPELPLGKSGREDVTDAAGMPVTVETTLAMNEHETTNSNPVAGLRTECTEPQPGIHAPAKVSSEQPRYPSLGLKALDPHWNVTMDTREFIERCLGEIYTQKYEVKGTPVPL